jgi:hypothetical protein
VVEMRRVCMFQHRCTTHSACVLLLACTRPCACLRGRGRVYTHAICTYALVPVLIWAPRACRATVVLMATSSCHACVHRDVLLDHQAHGCEQGPKPEVNFRKGSHASTFGFSFDGLHASFVGPFCCLMGDDDGWRS